MSAINPQQAIELFENINEATGILTNEIIREPNEKERDQLWDVVRASAEFIYKQDLNLTDKPLRDKLCHYSIVALHWSDLLMHQDGFSYSNGRFRRDTVALALCLFARIDNSYDQYYSIKQEFILPHTNFSVLLWVLRSIADCNVDNFWQEIDSKDASNAVKELLDEHRTYGWCDFRKIYQNDNSSTLVAVWLKLRKLFLYPGSETWIFIRKYIWNSSDIPGGLGLLPKDRDINKDFLLRKAEEIEFPNDWKFVDYLLYLFIFFSFKTDGKLDDGELREIKKRILEWTDNLDDTKYAEKYEMVYKVFLANSSLEKLYQSLHELKGIMIKNYTDEEGSIDQDKVSKQLSFVCKDLMNISYADGFCSDEEFQFVEAVRGIFGVDTKIYPDEGYSMAYNNGFDPHRKESFPEFHHLSDGNITGGLTMPEKNTNQIGFIDNYYSEFYHQNSHWGSIENLNNGFRIGKFPNYLTNTTFLKEDLFYKLTPDQVDQIVDKITETGSSIYLNWINERLSTKIDMRGMKSPFWFMPFACYGFDYGGFLIFEQNGIYTNFSDSEEIQNVVHVDFWKEISVQPGWNHLLDEWVEEGYYESEDLKMDEENITSLRIVTEKDGRKGVINIVDTHGPGVKSSLYILEAIWNASWGKVVKDSLEAGFFVLPREVEYFNSWEELIKWSQS